jgi:hypothetical protein
MTPCKETMAATLEEVANAADLADQYGLKDEVAILALRLRDNLRRKIESLRSSSPSPQPVEGGPELYRKVMTPISDYFNVGSSRAHTFRRDEEAEALVAAVRKYIAGPKEDYVADYSAMIDCLSRLDQRQKGGATNGK